MLLLLVIILGVMWLFSWGGPRYYPAYATRYDRYPPWGRRSHALLLILTILVLLFLLGAIRL